uniref:Opioid growth factor receptor n=1 Tax=Xenopus tropicalis TaxID=8364 RepID=F7CLQ9_XENTR
AKSHSWGALGADGKHRPHPSKQFPCCAQFWLPLVGIGGNAVFVLYTGDDIDTMLSDWRGDYVRLEENHSYIQWLFPLREEGVNPYAAPLTLREIEALKGDKDAMRRFREAYRLMLDFYGIELRDEDSGEVARAPNYKERFSNLNRRGHNNLRITRILKCLGELGYGRFQAPLVRFFLEETLVHKELPNVRHSALDYFMFTVRDREQRKELVLFAWEHFPHREGFIWGPRNYFQYRAAKNAESSADQEITQENRKRVRRLGEQEVQVMETKEKSWKSTEEKRVQRLREQEVLVMEIKEKSWKRQKGRGYRG